MGGIPPLGYDVVDRKLVVNETEADLVRRDLRRFLQLGSATELARELRQAGHTTKSWTTQDGKHRPGKPIDKGAIYKILDNRVYLGEAMHKARAIPASTRRSSSVTPGTRSTPFWTGTPAPRQRHPRADAGAAERPDLRARRPCDDAIAPP